MIVLAFACVAVMSALGKAAKEVPTGILVLFQNCISLLLFTPWILGKGVSQVRTSRSTLHILRAAAGLLSQVLMFVAVKRMPLVNAVLLSNSAPLFIPLVTWVWLKERIGGMVWVSLLIGFAGVILILKPGLALLSDPIALIAISAAVFSALALVAVNRLSSTESPQRILFYYFLYSSIAAAPFAVLAWRTPTAREWLFLAGIGLTMAASQLFIILAYKHATAGRIAPFNHRGYLLRTHRLDDLGQRPRFAVAGRRSTRHSRRCSQHQVRGGRIPLDTWVGWGIGIIAASNPHECTDDLR